LDLLAKFNEALGYIEANLDQPIDYRLTRTRRGNRRLKKFVDI